MSQLSDAIQTFGAQALADVLTAQPEFGVFNLMWSTASEIAPVCAAMGFENVDDVTAWVNTVNVAMGKASVFVDRVDPIVPVTLASMPTTDMPTIHKAIVDQALTRDDFFIDQSDALYHLPTKAQWELLARLCPINRRRWVAETGDCDDYVNAFRGWLAFHELGNLAQGFCSITNYGADGAVAGGHAVVLVMDDTKKLWFLDVQAARLFDVTYPKLGGSFFAKTVKIARAFF